MGKVIVDIIVQMTLHTDDNASIQEIVNELDCEFKESTGTATIEDYTIMDFNVISHTKEQL